MMASAVLCDLVGGQNGPKKSVDENFGRNLSSFIIRYRLLVRLVARRIHTRKEKGVFLKLDRAKA
jgi:hypothetical protein